MRLYFAIYLYFYLYVHTSIYVNNISSIYLSMIQQKVLTAGQPTFCFCYDSKPQRIFFALNVTIFIKKNILLIYLYVYIFIFINVLTILLYISIYLTIYLSSWQDAVQLVRVDHVRLHEGLRRLLPLRPLQGHQVPGNLSI